MKQNSPLINHPGRVAILLLVAGMAAVATGCRTANITVSPAARIQDAAGEKIPLSVGLMLDDRFCTNRFIPSAGARIYPFGPTLKQQSISLCEQTFEKVIVSTNGVVPAGVDVTLTPELHRSGVSTPSGSQLDIIVLLQWTLRTGDNRDILWMATIDGGGVGKAPKVYQLLFDDLATKSYRAFQQSPEIKRQVGKRPGTAT